MKRTRIFSIISIVLVIALLSMVFVGCKDDESKPVDPDAGKVELGVVNNNYKVGGTVVIGNVTEPSGDFRFAAAYSGSSVGAADQDIMGLTQGYSTMEKDRQGSYVWNKTVVKSHTEVENEDGTYTITVEINPGLMFSDGKTEVKADNYLAYAVAYSTTVAKAAGASGKAGQSFVGYDSFYAYNGANGDAEGVSAKFTGLKKLGDYKFSMTISSDYYPYYFAYTYGAMTPYDIASIIGDGATLKSDETGTWIEGNFYAKEAEAYSKIAHFKAARYDTKKYLYTGPYTISSWDKGTTECTMKINLNFQGNFEGQKPHIDTIVYKKVVSETQTSQLASGQLHVLEALTGGDDVKAGLGVMENNAGKFLENHYDRAGYGKVQFDCDFGPTQFQEVRQAVTYCLDRNDFAQAFTGGYGAVVNGPYSVNFKAYTTQEAELEEALKNYAVSTVNAKKVLEEGGWIYNSTGGAYVAGQTGIDSVRYKKLTNPSAYDISFKSISNEDGIEYKTVKVGDDYYMPLVINWFSTENNAVSDLLKTKLMKGNNVKEVGLVIRNTSGSFTQLIGEIYREPSYGYGGTPTYGMFNLATSWNSEVYDYSFNWSLDEAWFDYSANKLFDSYDKAFPYNDKADGTHTSRTFEEAMTASNGKLGMDYLSMAMVYDAKTEAEYNQYWKAYMLRWNELMPDIPLYSNVYYDVYSSKILNYKTSPFFGASDALLYCAHADFQG